MKKIMKFLMLAGMICQAQSAFAAGFAIAEQSVSAMGTAYASNTVGTDDATVVFANPAGMTSLCSCNDLVAGGFYILPWSHFKNEGSTRIGLPPFVNPPVPFPVSTNGGQVGETKFLPNLSYATKINDCLWVGISTNVPFGQVTDYNDAWYGRYYATRSEIITMNFNPAIAYKVNNCLSIGAGFNAMYFHANFKNMVDFGLIGTLLGVPGSIPEHQDGEAKLKGCCWGYGFNVGALYKFNCDRTRIGVQWRSQIKQKLKNGRIKFKNVPVALQPGFQNGGAHTTIKLPDVVSIGIMHRVDNCLDLYADFQWTHWALIPALNVALNNPPFEANTLLKWNNVWRFAVGFKYRFNNCIAIRGGYNYDQNPTPNEQYRSARLPDQDRQMAAAGLEYKLNENISFDLSYSHVFFKRTRINKTDFVKYPEYILTGGLRGRYRSYVNIAGAQAHLKF